MAEATQFSFDINELVSALLKAQNIHEGQWALEFGFSSAGFYAGRSPEEARQAIGISVRSAQISKVEPGDENYPPGVVFDAGELNPRQALQVPPAIKPRRRRAIDVE